MKKYTRYDEWRASKLENPEVREALEELEPAYIVARLRIERGLTQEQLAELVGTKQSSIARLESGRSQPRLSFLRRVVRALGAYLELRVIREEEHESTARPSVSFQSESSQNEWRAHPTRIHPAVLIDPWVASIKSDTSQASYLQ